MLFNTWLKVWKSRWTSKRRRAASDRRREYGAFIGRLPAIPRVERLEDRSLLSATLTTDRADYPPGSTAVLTASEFLPGETVLFQVTSNTAGVYPSWMVTDGGQGDLDSAVNGNIQTTWFVGYENVGATLVATAAGLTSELTAETTFTDNIGVPVTLGETGNKTSGTALSLGGVATPLAATVDLGDTVIITFAMDANAGAVTVSDSKGNAYTTDFNAQEGSGTSGVRTLVFSTRITEAAKALATTDTITVTFPTTAAKAISAIKVAGLVTSESGKDQTAFATGFLNVGAGTGTQPNSGNVTTTQADEILIGLVGTEFKQVAYGSNATAGAGFTSFTGAFANSGDSGANDTNISILGQYRIVSAIDTYSSGISIDGIPQRVDWCAGIVTFRAAAVSVAVAPASVAENSGAGLVYTFSRNGITTNPMTIHFTVSGTADSGTDYPAIGVSSVTIPANVSTASITVTPTGDTNAELDETVIFTITPNVGYLVGNGTATGTIVNDDVGVSIAKITDLAEPGTNGKFRLTLNQTVPMDTIVSYTVGGTATSGTDHTLSNGTATILANTTTVDIDVPVLDDVAVEGAETVVVTLTGTNNFVTVTAGAGVATATITDNDATTVSITASDAIASETSSNSGQFTVSLSGGVVAPTGGLTVNFVLTGSTATSGTDFTSIGTSVVIPAGTSSTTIDVSGISDDTLLEGTESVIVTLTTTSVPTLVTVNTTPATVTIADNESATLSIATPVTVTEAGGSQNVGVTLTITGSGTGTFALGSGITLSANVTQTGGTATSGADYTAFGTQTVTFDSGAATGAVRNASLAVLNDALLETSETVLLTLGSLNAGGTATTLGTTANTTTITDNETATLSIATPVTVNEGGGTQNVGVTLTITGTGSGTLALGSGITLSASVTQTGGTATSGDDYTAFGTQTVTFNSGATTGTVQNTSLAVLNDTVYEGSETVLLTLGSLNAGGTATTLGTTANTTTIEDNDVPPPVDTDAAANTVAEGAANGTTVGITASSSVPGGPAVTYSLTNDAGGRFAINTSTGVVTVANGSLLNFESAASHSITVQASDGVGGVATSNFTINVTNVNPSSPTDANGAANSVAEAAANGTAVGVTASSSDPNGPAVTYSLTDDAGGRFAISSSTGVVTIANGALLNFESATSHSITVQASDGAGGTASASFTISVTNVNPSTPTDANAATNSVAEGASNGTSVGVTASSSDPNGPAVVYSLTDDAGGRFAISSSTGVVTIANSALLNFESASSHSITVQASDGSGGTSSASFTINVTNVNPSMPTDANGAANSVAEATANGTAVGVTASSSDPNGPAVIYTLTNDAGGRFAIDSSTGVVTVANSALLNFESASSHSITVQASDGAGGTSSASFTINVTNVNPSTPTDGNAAANSVAEGTANGTAVGVTASSSDPNGPAVTYSLTVDAGGRFTINSSTGVVTVANGSLLDGVATHPITVQASDGSGGTSTANFSIDVNNVAPTIALTGDASVDEESPYTLNLGAITDPGSDTVTSYSINWGDGNIENFSGSPVGLAKQHTYADGGSYTITVSLTDEDGTFAAGTFNLTVNFIVPTIVLTGNATTNEGATYTLNLGTITNPGTVSGYSIDWGDGVTESFSGNPQNTTKTHIYTDGQPVVRTISVSLTNQRGTFPAVGTLDVTVLNVAPSLAPTMGELYSATYTGADLQSLITANPALAPSGTRVLSGTRLDFTNTVSTGILLDLPLIPAGQLSAGNTITFTITADWDNLTADADLGWAISDGTNVVGGNLGQTNATNSFFWLEMGTDAGNRVNPVNYPNVANLPGNKPFTTTVTITPTGSVTVRGTNNLGGTFLYTTQVTMSLNIANALSVLMVGDTTGESYGLKTLSLQAIGSGVFTNNGPINEGGAGSVYFTAEPFDPSPEDVAAPLKYSYDFGNDGTWDIGDGTWAGGVLAASVAIPASFNDGTVSLPVRGRVMDKDFAVDGDTSDNFSDYFTNVVIINVAPTIALSGASVVAPGVAYSLDLGAITDPGQDMVTAFSINWGDGTTENFAGSPVGLTKMHTYASEATRTITVSLTDEDGTFTGGTKIVTVSNSAPSIALTGNATTNEGSSYTLNLGTVTNPGTITGYSINWGDGVTENFSGNPENTSRTHTYADGSAAGTPRTITVSITNGSGTFTSGSLGVTVNNVAPTISSASNNGPVNETSSVTVTVSASDVAGVNDPLSYEFDFDNNGTFEVEPQSSSSAQHTFNDNGSYTVNVRVTDGDGGSATSSTVVTVNNVAPTISAVSNNGPVSEATPVTVTVSASDVAGINDPLSYEFDFDNNGTFEVGPQSGSSAQHTFSDSGSYTVNVRVTDGDGGSATSSTVVTVNNVAPTISTVSNDGPVNEASPVTVTVSASDVAGVNDPLSYEFDFDNNGTFEVGPQSSNSAQHTFNDNGSYTVNVRVTDGDGGSATSSTVVTVNNVAPTISAVSNNGPVNEGTQVTVTVTASDVAGINDPLSYEFDFDNNGTYEVGPQASSSAQHTFNDNGTYTVNVRVTDGDGGSATGSTVVTVSDTVPTIALTGDATTNEGSLYTLNLGTVTNPGTITGYSIDWGDGVTENFSGNPENTTRTHTYADGSAGGTLRTITVSITNGSGTYTSGTHSVTVNNVGPTINTVSNNGPVNEASPVTVTVSASDVAGVNDPLSYEFDFDNNGTFEVGPQSGNSAQHTFNDNGSYTVNVRVTDGDGGSATSSTVVTVNNVAPTISTVSNNGPVNEGSSVTVTVSASDVAGINDPLSYEFDFDNNGTFEVGPQSGNSAQHTFSDNGSYTVNVRVTDGDGGSATGSTVVTVNNVAPTIALSGLGTATSGVAYSLGLGAITDPGQDTVTAYSIDWGDGTIENFSGSPVGLTKMHTFASAATRTITVSLTDEDGTFTGGTKSVTVSAPAAPPFNLGPTTYTGAQLDALVPSSASYPSGTHSLTGTRLDLTGTVVEGVVFRMPLAPAGTLSASSSVTFTTTVDWDNLSSGKGDNDFGIGISDGVNVIAGQVADQNRFFLEQGNDAGTHLTNVVYPNNANLNRSVPFTVEITVTPTSIKVRGTNGAGATFQHTATSTLNLSNALSLVLLSNNVGEKYGVKTLTLQVATAGAVLNGGELLVTGTAANDEVLVRQSGDGTQVIVDASFNGGSTTSTAFPIASVTSVRMRLGSGDDKGFVRNNGSPWAMPSNLSGEDGNDLLVTTDGDDTITGGRGRDFIIGGAGADLIDGGTGEDLLISGTTSHDGNTTALTALMTEWTSNGNYSQRLTRLQNGTGATNGNKLIGNDGATQTVFADASVDLLAGAADTDAFWANLVADNGGALDVISDLIAGESTFDTDL